MKKILITLTLAVAAMIAIPTVANAQDAKPEKKTECCKKTECKKTECKNTDCKKADCKKADCNKTDCKKADCKNTGCNKADCNKADCKKVDCNKTDCKNADCKGCKTECGKPCMKGASGNKAMLKHPGKKMNAQAGKVSRAQKLQEKQK